jgi:hypothetical protein
MDDLAKIIYLFDARRLAFDTPARSSSQVIFATVQEQLLSCHHVPQGMVSLPQLLRKR